MWTTARTWVTGELVTSTEMNEQIRDNLGALRGSSHLAAPATNYGGTTPVPWASSQWDDLGVFVPSQAFVTVPWAGRFRVSLYALVQGQSGSGSGGLTLNRLDSAGALIETLCSEPIGFNSGVSMTALGDFAAGDRIQVEASNGATGTAGTVAVRATVEAHG